MADKPKNILFIMCDQLRWDYLSCYGHPTLLTKNIDRLASRSLRFTRAFVQSPVCGSSRMSFYTGRYVRSHGASYNGVPLKVGEWTMGDYLRPLGLDTALVGKTHMKADAEGMEKLGIEPDSIIGVRVAECGFDPYERDDGLHAHGPVGRYDPREPAYNRYLNQKGYGGDNPWHDWANAAEGEGGELASGWAMRHARKPARVNEEHSETPYMTRRAMDYISEHGSRPWCLHLSYIKPHWPYIAPEPYNDMYGPTDVIKCIRSDKERENPHPVFREFMAQRVSKNFSRDEVRREVIPAYMGLIKQIDDSLGMLFDFLDNRGLFGNTMIVFTSDHGDYLGDHWLGEKDLFHEPSVRVPLIVYDPSPEANATRGKTTDALVESIDLLPTFIDYAGGDSSDHAHRLEGRSLKPLLAGARPEGWRQYVFSEYDYSMREEANRLKKGPRDAWLFMVRGARYKYIHAPGYRPMMFDLEEDPNEFSDLGADPRSAVERTRMAGALQEWALRNAQRTTADDETVMKRRAGAEQVGIHIGVWDEAELEPHYWDAYRGGEG